MIFEISMIQDLENTMKTIKLAEKYNKNESFSTRRSLAYCYHHGGRRPF